MSEETHLKIAEPTPDFAALRGDNSIYVDKTMYFHKLITQSKTCGTFFISRPRRFGKSLMISTLKYIFQGRRDLFKGLYIDTQTDYDWKIYPVIHLDFSDIDTDSKSAFVERFEGCVKSSLESVGYKKWPPRNSATTNFDHAIKALSAGGSPVVVLVDEYDAPITHALDNPKMAEFARKRLATFYALIKKLSGSYIRFLMMTGVAKLAKVSVFSSMNNTSDITLNPDYAAMLGYTDDELEANFSEYMHARADSMGLAYENYRAELKRWYNGYRFTRDETKVYNPISIAESLKSKDLHMTADWSATGRPSMLATFLRAHDITSMPFEKGIPADISELETSSDFNALKPKAILYQTGYLTIVRADFNSDSIVLGFPDEEIRRDMYRFVSGLRANDENWCKEALNYLKIGDIDTFLERLTSLYAGLPTGAKVKRLPESHYQDILQTAMLSAGFICNSECVQSSRKRCDTVVETPNNICIFEFKVGKRLSAKTAVRQIIERDYAAPHLGKGKPVFAVGLIFHPEDHTLRDSDWKAVTR